MEKAILDFPKQLAWEPEIQHASHLKQRAITIVGGMGGSHLPADILQAWNPLLDIVVQNDYGLSGIPESVLKNSLIVASSYSGNTEETLSIFDEALQKQLSLAVLSTGGHLLELAKQHSVPYAQVLHTNIQPRSALGFMTRGLAKIMGEQQFLKETKELSFKLRSEDYKEQGKELAKDLKGKIPVIYSSQRNFGIVYNWKIQFNETGKIPAFCNVFPEINHNEMTGFDVQPSTRSLCEKFYCIVLKDFDDHPKVIKRMEVFQKLYRQRDLPLRMIEVKGFSRLEKIFSSLLLADWAAYYTALAYGVDSEQLSMVEEFKKLIAA